MFTLLRGHDKIELYLTIRSCKKRRGIACRRKNPPRSPTTHSAINITEQLHVSESSDDNEQQANKVFRKDNT